MPSEILRYTKGIIAHRVIKHLKEEGYQSSLEKLRHEEWKRRHRYSLWGHESNVFLVTSENIFMQKVNYIHQNPVRDSLVERSIDYHASSARFWQRCKREDDFCKLIWIALLGEGPKVGHSPTRLSKLSPESRRLSAHLAAEPQRENIN